MPSCERCWSRSTGPYAEENAYWEELKNHTCTPEQQAGPDSSECPVCRRMTIHQHIPDYCMACGKDVSKVDLTTIKRKWRIRIVAGSPIGIAGCGGEKTITRTCTQREIHAQVRKEVRKGFIDGRWHQNFQTGIEESYEPTPREGYTWTLSHPTSPSSVYVEFYYKYKIIGKGAWIRPTPSEDGHAGS